MYKKILSRWWNNDDKQGISGKIKTYIILTALIGWLMTLAIIILLDY